MIKKMIDKFIKDRVYKLSVKAANLYMEDTYHPEIEKLYREIEFLLAPRYAIMKSKRDRIENKILKISLMAGNLYLINPENPDIEKLYNEIEILSKKRNKIQDSICAL